MPARRLLLTGAFLSTTGVAFGQAPPPGAVPDGTVTVTPPPAAGEVPPPGPVTETVQPPVPLTPEPAPHLLPLLLQRPSPPPLAKKPNPGKSLPRERPRSQRAESRCTASR